MKWKNVVLFKLFKPSATTSIVLQSTQNAWRQKFWVNYSQILTFGYKNDLLKTKERILAKESFSKFCNFHCICTNHCNTIMTYVISQHTFQFTELKVRYILYHIYSIVCLNIKKNHLVCWKYIQLHEGWCS